MQFVHLHGGTVAFRRHSRDTCVQKTPTLRRRLHLGPLQAASSASWCRPSCMHAPASAQPCVQQQPAAASRPVRLAPLRAAAVGSATLEEGTAAAADPAAATAGLSQRRILQGVSAQRVQRLEALVELKKLYRNIIRAEALLALPSPVYAPPQAAGVAAADAAAAPAGSAAAGVSNDSFASPDSSGSDLEDEEAERTAAAVEVVAEMQLTAEQLKVGLRALPPNLAPLFGGEDGEGVDAGVRDLAKRCASELRQRVSEELPLLPFSSPSKAQAACDVRNSRYDRRLQAAVDPAGADTAPSSGLQPSSSFPDRLNKAEKVAGKFVAKRIRPALQRAREKELPELLSEGRAYLSGLWSRLNGGGGRARRDLPPELVVPAGSQKEVDKRIHELRLRLEGLDKRLVEASKAREARLRKAGAAGRIAVAIQLRTMDAEVVAISRLLAVGALQLEMEYIFRGLEEEALDVSGDDLRNSPKGPALARENTTGELALLVAEYGLLLEQLDVLSDSISSQMAPLDAAAASHHGQPPQPLPAAAAAGAAGKSAGLSIVNDDLLTELAAEIPDLRYRVGVSDAEVFGANPLSPTRLKLQVRENSLKVVEGVNFLTRGVRLLLSDIGNAGRLFTKAALGGTLKPREVAALRRTARDLLSFIPFVIILIIPLTPLGHVLVFGFIQRYFPGFFPSQFTNQRQDLMMRYEELQRQLVDAQAAAEIEEEEAELARAAAAVARLTAPEPGSNSSSTATITTNNSTSGGSNSSYKSSGPGSNGAAAVAAAAAAAGSNGSRPASVPGSVELTAVDSSDEEGSGPAAAKLRLLEQEVEEARQEVHDAPEDDAPGARLSMRH